MTEPAEVDELGLLVCDEDLELVAGELDFHANALKTAVTVGHTVRLVPRRHSWDPLIRRACLTATHIHLAQNRLLTLKSKLAASVDALEAERRFIVARSITLQNQADSLKARPERAPRCT